MFLDSLNGYSFVLDVEPQAREESHIKIRHPYQREKRDDVSPPVIKEQLVTRDHQENGRHVVTETVLASKQVEELSAVRGTIIRALALAILARFAEHFFVSDRPCDRRNGEREDNQPDKLYGNRHGASMPPYP
jgi:hypothetical protein